MFTSDSGAGEPTPTPTPEPAAAAPPAAPPAPPSGPWADKLSVFDESTRAQVDAFLRTEVQPYVTRLEQQTSELEAAGQLYNDLQSDPLQTYVDLTHEMLGDEIAEAVIATIRETAASNDAPDADTSPNTDPVVEQMKRDYIATQEQKEYADALAKAKSKHPDIVEDLFHPFAAATDGDMEAAYQGYKVWLEQAKQTFGTPEAPPPAPTPAPPTLGSDTANPPAPPTQKQYRNIGEALDDMFDEIKVKTAPPTVGSV